MWCARPRWVALTKDTVEVQQAMRRDVVAPKEITVGFDGADLVLLADAVYEARFIGEETRTLGACARSDRGGSRQCARRRVGP